MKTYILLCAAALPLLAQTPLTFEVASIKPAAPLTPMAVTSGGLHFGMKIDGAMVDIGSFTLRDLIRTAYDVKDFQISAPDWLTGMSAPRFDILATLPEGARKDQVPQMLQALLAERFKLEIHRETKEHNVYALVVGKNGAKLKESDPDPVPSDAGARPPAEAPDSKRSDTVIADGSNQVRVSGNPGSARGIVVSGAAGGPMRMSMVDGKMHMEASKMTMTALADLATRFTDRPVVDMTELKGTYKVSLELSMADLRMVAAAAGMNMGGGRGGEGGKPADAASDPGGASIFQSIQQLGLKLEPRKAPLTNIVVDHVEKSPTAN